jgi:hypothetical protein
MRRAKGFSKDFGNPFLHFGKPFDTPIGFLYRFRRLSRIQPLPLVPQGDRAMKCIDAIEGTVKKVIDRIHRNFVEDRQDDTEYIRNVQQVIDAAGTFVEENKEVIPEPEALRRVLYEYAKEKWMDQLHQSSASEEAQGAALSREDIEYYEYYYDHIYRYGTYPP